MKTSVKTSPALSVALVVLTMPVTGYSADFGTYTRINSIAFSEILPIDQIVQNEPVDFEEGELAFTYNRFEFGFSWRNFRIGYIARYDYRLEFSEDTARFYYEEEGNVERGDSERSYDVFLDVMHQRSQGVAFSYDWQWREDLRITPSLSLLYANAVLDGRISGDAQFLGGSTFSGNLELDYHYEKDYIFDRELGDDSFRGRGYSLDVAVDWQPSEQWQFHLQTHDLLAYIHWRDVPRTVADADAEPAETDDPFERYRDAAVRGKETTGSFRQRITPRASLGGRFRYGNFSVPLDFYIEPDRIFVFPSLAYHIGSWELALMAEPRVEAYGFRIGHPWLSFSLMADSVDYKKAKFFSLGMRVQVPLF